jgi:Ser-tRNA(Ala) deacylase AlaX
MRSEKVFWADPYLNELACSVTAVRDDAITVDQTIFFAFSGGQESDAGTIGGRIVLEARKEGQSIWYRLPTAHGLQAGDAVVMTIDAERRGRLMRLHFAAELVLELMCQHYSPLTKVGAHISADKARLDFLWDGSIAGAIVDIKPKLRELVVADLPIVSRFTDPARELRCWEVSGFASVACGGTHPRRTGEVGVLRLKRNNIGKGKERIEITLAD